MRLCLFLQATYSFTISAQAVGDKNILELTNKLGVKTTFFPYSDLSSKLGESIAEQICTDYRVGRGLVLKIEEGTYILVPLESFKDAVLKDGKHTVTLTNGKTITGKLIGKIENDNKIYDLPSISNIRVVQINKSDTAKSKPPVKSWELISAKPSLAKMIIAEPRFAFGYRDQYKESQGIFYTWATGTFIQVSESFIIKVGAEEMTANLSDFEKVSTNVATQPVKITTTAQSNVTTTGALILKSENKSSIGWALIARLPEMADVTIVLMKQNFVFQEK